MSSEIARIQSRATGEAHEATLVEGMLANDLLLLEGEWKPDKSQIMQALLVKGTNRAEWPQSLHWDWARKAPQLLRLDSKGFGIFFDKQWQGAMMTKTIPYLSRIKGKDEGKPLLYIDFIEVAPWNWSIPEIGRLGRFKLVGTNLFIRAVRQSEEEGFHGRIGLHSLPQSVPFYTGAFNMTLLGPDPTKQNLLFLELTRENAAIHLI